MEDSTKNKLRDLKDDVYNAEDVLDGCFNQDAIEYNDIPNITLKYKTVLKELRQLEEMLQIELNK